MFMYKGMKYIYIYDIYVYIQKIYEELNFISSFF